MTPITLDPNLSKKLDQGMRFGDSAELPFPAVFIWALNGQASYKSQGGALYYGGWACKSNDLQIAADQQDLALPLNWQQVTISSRDGGEFPAHTTRSIVIAPIGKRLSWLHEGKRFAAYIEGGRRHLQVLVYLADFHIGDAGKEISPWGAAVLTAKGYQARNLLDAFTKWERATAQARRKVASGVPAWCFYMSIGTFGKDRHAVNVGKSGAQSPITPISAFIPDQITDEMIENLFVGNEIAAKMVDFQDQAAEWLKAWQEPSPADSPADMDLALSQDDDIPI
jgi:hypothetical protein